MTDPMYDPLRDYDQALVDKLQATVAPGEKHYSVTVPGIATRVPVLFGLVEDWFATHELPAINVVRKGVVPAPARRLPGFIGKELSTNPETPNTWNIQTDPPQPVNLAYDIEVVGASQVHLNALVLYVLWKVPTQGFGTSILVNGKDENYFATGMRDDTPYRVAKDGRQLINCLQYTVEGWYAPTLACEKVPQILHVDIGLEAHTSRDLQVEPPVPESEAVEVHHITYDAP